MRRTSFESVNCSVARALEIVGEWWSLLIVRDALLGVRRFDDFQARLGISRNVLAQRLQTLVDQGVLERVPYSEHPPRHEYRLTEKGRALWQVVNAMREWGDAWAPTPGGPPSLLVHRTCGEVTRVVPTCEHCGEELVGPELRAIPGPGSDGSLPPVPDRRRAPAAG
jgi:DNA-binding HxlR family transcriptional regulator